MLDFGIDRENGTQDHGEGNGVWDGETFIDLNGNGNWEKFILNDLNNDGLPSPGEIGVDEEDEKDFSVNYGQLSNKYKDANDDGISDYPQFNVRNLRYDIRMDWEPNPDAFVLFLMDMLGQEILILLVLILIYRPWWCLVLAKISKNTKED